MGTVAVKWLTSKLMTGIDSRGKTVVIGTWAEADPPWAGLKPSDMLLLAAASCSAHDVVLILEKKREPLVGLEVSCTGHQEEAPPYRFTSIHLQYTLFGELDPAKVATAISLSEDKYCSVINTLKPGVKISHDYQIVMPGEGGTPEEPQHAKKN
jgi:putative redox protein